MNLKEWTAQVSKEFLAAGFEVTEYQGFPLVKAPPAMNEMIRFLEFKASIPVSRIMYAEGCILTPAGIPPADQKGA